MSYKTLLVHAEAGDGADERIKLAMDVAAMFDARIIGLGAEGFFPLLSSGYAAADGAVIEAVRERIAADLPRAEQRFRSLTQSVAGGVDWVSGYDYPAAELAIHARAADLIVSSRPPHGATAAFSAPAADVVLQTGVPVLFGPGGVATLKAEHVLLAWKNTREARRALADSLPFLMRAQKVTVAVVSEESSESEHVGLDQVARRLVRHGVDVDTQVVRKGRHTVAEALEHTAASLSADLIVMGAYGHSRFQEWVLGGATEDLLASSSRFVLFSH